MIDYEQIKDLAKEHKCKVTDLIALAPQNDPFYVGTDGQRALGEWFAELWQRFGYRSGVHLRRIHYQILSQDPPVIMPNGKPYENTEGCWELLGRASKAARYLDLVDAADFDDRRNPAPVINAERNRARPTIDLQDADVSSYDTELPDFPDLPDYGLDHYEGEQAYMLEIWCEKSTMNDVLLPLCARYDANLVTGVGELSATATLTCVRRIAYDKRPVRIFYISDFDPAGQCMPVSAARKLEYFLGKHAPGADVRLFPVALTAEQCRAYRLPRTPIKDSELRRQGFEDRYGEGATELDALQALHPGELARILQDAMGHYYDAALGRKVANAQYKLKEDLDNIWNEVTDTYSQDLRELQEEYQALREEFDHRVENYGQRLTALWRAISQDLESRMPDLADYPVPEPAESAELGDGLFNSDRDYIEQMTAYKDFQGRNMPTMDNAA